MKLKEVSDTCWLKIKPFLAVEEQEALRAGALACLVWFQITADTAKSEVNEQFIDLSFRSVPKYYKLLRHYLEMLAKELKSSCYFKRKNKENQFK